jgi:hypothetical protein
MNRPFAQKLCCLFSALFSPLSTFPGSYRSHPFRQGLAVILFCLLTCFPADASDLDQWKALLHYQGGRSLVQSGGFFLHENGSIDPGAELKKTISLLESPDGITTACRFPARYLWIADNELSSSRYDLTICQDLNQFVRGFPGDTVNLVLVSEDINTPEAAFGHMLLSFSDSSRQPDETEFIHFFVEETNDAFLTQTWKGLFGGYTLRLVKASFLDIHSYYNVGQQRALNIYRLDLDPPDIRRLLYHLFELEESKFVFYFTKENCAFYIASLLDIIYMENRTSYRRSPYVLPSHILHSYSDHILDSFTLEPSLLKEYLDNAGKTVPAEHEKLPEADVTNSISENEAPDPGTIHTGALLGVGVARREAERFDHFRFRAYGKGIRDVQSKGIKEYAFSIVDLSLMSNTRDEIDLNYVDIVNIRSIFSRQVHWSSMSWSLYAGRNRENSARELAWDFRLGMGTGVGNMHMGVSVMLEGGVQSDEGDGNSYLAPRGDFLLYLKDSVKTGITFWKKYGSSGEFSRGELFMNWDFGKGSILATVERSEPTPVDSTTVTLHWKL